MGPEEGKEGEAQLAYELYPRASKFYQRAAHLTQMSGTIKRKEGEAMVRDNTLRAAPRLHTPLCPKFCAPCDQQINGTEGMKAP